MTSVSPIDLSVIIVSCNVRSYLLNCVRSIYAAASGFNIEVIVVDNASTDGSLPAAVREFPRIIGIQNNQNLGFGSACNQGLSIAKGKAFLLLNPDVVIEESLFDRLLPAMSADRRIGLMGCKILNDDGSLQLACRRSFPTPWIAFTRFTGLARLAPKSPLFARYNLTHLDENQSCEPDAISGSFMLLSREAYEATGGFDEQFFMYGEDLDLCYRVKRAGFKVVYNPSASIIHFKGKSAAHQVNIRDHFYRAMKIFIKKHGPKQLGMLLLLNLAITMQSLGGFLRSYASQIIAVFIDFGLTVGWMELLARYRYGSWFPFPGSAYPVVYFLLFGIQIPIYGWFGVYSSRFGVKRKIALAGFMSWLSISVGAYYSKEFAFSRLIFLGLMVLSPLSHIAWRAALTWLRQEAVSRSAVLVTSEAGFQMSEWFGIKYILLEGMEIRGMVVHEPGPDLKGSPPVLGAIADLESVVREYKITDVLIDVDQIRTAVQFELMQVLKGFPLKIHRVSENGIRDSLLNEVVNREEKTGVLFRWIKKLTDALLYLEFHRRLRSGLRPEMITDGGRRRGWLLSWGEYLVGARTPHKFVRSGFNAWINLDRLFPGLNGDEDRLTVFMLYNRLHSYQLDRRILSLLRRK